MNNRDVKELIEKGESQWCEFKLEIPKQASDLGKEMVAFANTEGGTLLVGVEDDGSIHGVENPREIMERLSGIAIKGCNLVIKPEIGTITLEGKSIVYASVLTCPIATYKGRIYKRIGNISEELDAVGINALVESLRDSKNPPQLRFDNELIEEKPKSALVSANYIFERNLFVGVVSFLIIMFISVSLFEELILNIVFITASIFAVFWLFALYPYSYKKMLHEKMPKTLGHSEYLGAGEMLVNYSDDTYFISKPFARCSEPYCEGNIILDDCPDREKEHRNRAYVGKCSTADWDHSYEIDYNLVASPTKFDRRPLER